MLTVGFIQTATYDLTPEQLRLSPFFWTAFTALNKIHGVWRWYRRVDVYRNPDNLVQLLAGHAVNYVFGDSVIVRIAAQCLLVATRLLECVQQQAELYQSCCRWMEAVKGQYPKIVKVKWLRECSYGSPSTIHWWRLTAHSLVERVKRIIFCTLSVFKHAFKLSMCIMDVMEAFYWSPSVKQDAVGESFVNITKWLTVAVEQKEELLQGIADNKAIIQKLLERSPLTYQMLYQGIERTLDNAETVFHGVKTISDLGGKTALRIGKRMISGGMVVMGLGNYCPNALVDKESVD